jgi:energy-coupling factor transporter ATP-binding protein EcfA2
MNKEGELVRIPNIGIPGGSLVSIIGSTGNGKTTLAVQMGWNIVKNFDDGMLIIVDCEKSSERERICNILNCARDEPRLRLNKEHSSIDDVLESFDILCKTKEAGGKRYMYEVKNRTFNGESFWTYVPTVYIIDSLPKFNCRDFNDKDLGGNTDSMRGAKDVTRFYTNIVDRAWQFNVIFIVINHIRPNLIMNPYASPPRGLMMINPQSETLPRGSVAQYYSSIYFRINSKKSAAYTIADDGFTGFKCDIQLAKSRTNIVGSTFPVTFNSDRGFDPVYSMYEFASSLGLVQGRNPYLTIKGFEERKFNRKEFVTLMTVDENFRNGVLTVLRPYYESLLSSKKEKVEEIKEMPNLSMVED